MEIKVETNLISPRLIEKHIRRVLAWINLEDLKALHTIRVVDESPLNPKYSKHARYLSGYILSGHYEARTEDRKAAVVLYVPDVYFGIPKRLLGTSIATLRIARTLAHEIGHHVVATRGYIYKPWEKYQGLYQHDPYEEDMVSAYSSDVSEMMLRQWRYKFARFLTEKYARLLHKSAIQDYWDGNYHRCAQEQFCSYQLDPTNAEAFQWYRQAMEKLKTQTPSPLNDAERNWLLTGYNGNLQETTARIWRLNQIKEQGRRKKKRAPKARRST